jgi:hypothetical protein
MTSKVTIDQNDNVAFDFTECLCPPLLIGLMILSVCLFAKYTFPRLDGVFSPKLMLPARQGGQKQGALMICTVNVQLWHPFLAKGDTFEIW